MASNHTCLVVISLDSALKKNENYYLRVFSKECKYIQKKVVRHINDNLSDFSYSDESDEDYLFFVKRVSWLFFWLIINTDTLIKFKM